MSVSVRAPEPSSSGPGPKRATPPRTPPTHIELPRSTFVFSSSRNPRSANSPLPSTAEHGSAPPSAISGEHRNSRAGSSAGPGRSRVTLSEAVLARHSRGAQDVRAGLVCTRTPTGFIAFAESGPTSPTSLTDPPGFDPATSYFPPVLVLGTLPRLSTAAARALPLTVPEEVDEVPASAPPVMENTAPAYALSDASGDFTPPSAYAAYASGPLSSQSSTSTLVSTTDLSINGGRLGRSGRSYSTVGYASSASSTAPYGSHYRPLSTPMQELSLTELFAGDQRLGGPPAAKRSVRRTKENVGSAPLKPSAHRRHTSTSDVADVKQREMERRERRAAAAVAAAAAAKLTDDSSSSRSSSPEPALDREKRESRVAFGDKTRSRRTQSPSREAGMVTIDHLKPD